MSNFQEWWHNLDERAAQSAAQIRDLVESAAPNASQVRPVTIASDAAFMPLRNCYDWFFSTMQRVSMDMYAYHHPEWLHVDKTRYHITSMFALLPQSSTLLVTQLAKLQHDLETFSSSHSSLSDVVLVAALAASDLRAALSSDQSPAPSF